jgi:hypothetical protein
MVEENTFSGACLNLKRRKIIHKQNESPSEQNLSTGGRIGGFTGGVRGVNPSPLESL